MVSVIAFVEVLLLAKKYPEEAVYGADAQLCALTGLSRRAWPPTDLGWRRDSELWIAE